MYKDYNYFRKILDWNRYDIIFTSSGRLLVVRKTIIIEIINRTRRKEIDHFKDRSRRIFIPDSFKNLTAFSVSAKTSIWNLKMPVSREISAAEARKSAALPFLPDVGTRFEVTRQSPETVLTLIYASAPGQDGRILLYPQPQTFSRWPLQLNVVRGLEKRATLKGQLPYPCRDE